MKAMILNAIQPVGAESQPLSLVELPVPSAGEKEILIKVSACGVCHTELDEIEGRTAPPHLPVIPGHQVVGKIVALGKNAHLFTVGDRIGVAWIYSACGSCKFCITGEENLCRDFEATGRDVNGGYAEFMVAREDFVYRIPGAFSDAQAAPLLCAGAIGYRSIALSGLKDGENLGLTGFGASAHLVLKMVRHRYPNARTFVFARSETERAFAQELGAVWAGDTAEKSPEPLDCIIDTTPVWTPVVKALANLAPGGRLVINAIRKEATDRDSLLQIDYPSHLWMEKEIKSVANVARRDVREFLALAAEINLKPEVEEFALTDANRALVELKQKKIRGAKVLRIEG
jgi:propanol-preferring alcohol dehydrogenase